MGFSYPYSYDKLHFAVVRSHQQPQVWPLRPKARAGGNLIVSAIRIGSLSLKSIDALNSMYFTAPC